MSNNKPYITAVFASRNDNYGENAIDKLSLVVNFFLFQCKKYDIDNEVILVDWNQVEDKLNLKKVVKIKKEYLSYPLKIIDVDSKYHKQYAFWDKSGLHNGPAYNIGIRRASGEFIVQIANDVFWSDDVFQFIAEKKLVKGNLYRCNRNDSIVNFEYFSELDYDEIPHYMEKNINFVHEKLNYPKKYKGTLIPDLHTNASGDFQLLHRDDWYKLRGYQETKTVASEYIDGQLAFTAYIMGVKEVILNDKCKVYKVSHGKTNNNRIKINPSKIEKFLFPEYLDKIKMIQKFKVIFRSYILYPKTYAYGIEIISYEEWLTNIVKMVKEQKVINQNSENWGYSNIDFEKCELKNEK